MEDRCVEPIGELFLLGLDTRYDKDNEEFFIQLAIEVAGVANFGVGFRFGEICSVTLPDELAYS